MASGFNAGHSEHSLCLQLKSVLPFCIIFSRYRSAGGDELRGIRFSRWAFYE